MIIDKEYIFRLFVCLGLIIELTVIGDYFRITYGYPKSISLILFSIPVFLTIKKIESLHPIEVISIIYILFTELLFGFSSFIYVIKFVMLYLIFRLNIVSITKLSDFFNNFNIYGLIMLVIVSLYPVLIILENEYVNYLRKSNEGYGSLYYAKNFSGLLLIGDDAKSVFGIALIRYAGHFFEPAVLCFYSILFLLFSNTNSLTKKLVISVSIFWSFSVVGMISLLIYWFSSIIQKVKKKYLIFIIPTLFVISFPILSELYLLVLSKLSSTSGLMTMNIWLSMLPSGPGYGCSWNVTTTDCQDSNTFSFIAWMVFFVLLSFHPIVYLLANRIKMKHAVILVHVGLFLLKSPFFVLFSPLLAVVIGRARWRMDIQRNAKNCNKKAITVYGRNDNK